MEHQQDKLMPCKMNGGTKLDMKSLIKCENQISTMQSPHTLRSHAFKRDKAVITKDHVILEEMVPPVQGSVYTVIHGGDDKGDTFYRAIGPLITCVQFFGLMPLTGILGEDPMDLRFTWYSWKIVYNFLIMFFLGAMSCAGFYTFFRTSVTFSNFDGVVFYFSAFLTNIAFLRLAQIWPRLSLTIAKGEVKKTCQQSKSQSLYIRFGIYNFLILFLALVEHLMRIVSDITIVYKCDLDKSLDYKLYKSSYRQIFSHTDYAVWKGAILQAVFLVATFNWTFKDLFIILISVVIAQRFEHLNESLNVVLGKHLPKQFWKGARSEYTRLANLVEEVDTAINKIIMISFANNLYSICWQLFNSLSSTQKEKSPQLPCWKHTDGGLATAVYFVYSFSFLITRFMAVALSASRIHSASKGPLKALYNVPSDSYCSEVRRFLEQVTTDTVALTGLHFFYVTRGLILTIIGTVATYELVLVQFNSPAPSVSANITLNGSCGVTPIDRTLTA